MAVENALQVKDALLSLGISDPTKSGYWTSSRL